MVLMILRYEKSISKTMKRREKYKREKKEEKKVNGNKKNVYSLEGNIQSLKVVAIGLGRNVISSNR